MLEKFDQFHLLQTVIETDHLLSSWIRQLVDNYYLELGSDPQLVGNIRQDLEIVANRIFEFDKQFEIDNVPIRQANTFLTTTSQLENTISFVKNIQKEAYGTQKNTRMCIEKLNLCVQGVREVGQFIQPGFSTLKH